MSKWAQLREDAQRSQAITAVVAIVFLLVGIIGRADLKTVVTAMSLFAAWTVIFAISVFVQAIAEAMEEDRVAGIPPGSKSGELKP